MPARNRFIDDVDLSEATSLMHLLDRHDGEETDEMPMLKHSPYYTEQKFKNLLRNRGSLCILDLNIANVFAKFDQLEAFVDRMNTSNPISAICLNECWIQENTDLATVQLQNYKMFCKPGNRPGHGHCGLLIYIHEQYKCSEISFDNSSTDWDSLCVEFSTRKANAKKYILTNFYRLPGGNIEQLETFTDEFVAMLRKIANLKHTAYVCGDQNIDLLHLNQKQHINDFFERVTLSVFFPNITLPTRISLNGTSATLIDNIYSFKTQEFTNSKSGILINDISDHKIIFTCEANTTYIEPVPKYIEIEKHNELSIQNFVDELNRLNIYDTLCGQLNNNSHDSYELFSRLIKFAREKHFPKKKVKFDKRKHKKSKWITNGILNSIHTKDKLYKLFIQADSENIAVYEALEREFKTYRAKLRKSIRAAKKAYFTRTFNAIKNDIRKTWSVINQTLNRKKQSQLPNEFKINNLKTTDPNEIANAFNDYFINIGRSIAEQIHTQTTFDEYMGNPSNSRFTFLNTTEVVVSNIINKLKNKSSFGHDNISNILIKQAKDVLVKPLTLLINLTLQTGEFPNELKISRVKPLFKNGDESLMSNYRPISLLPSFGKIFEYVIFHQLSDYLRNHDLLCSQQFGFRPAHSTDLAALRLLDHLTKEMDTNNIPINVYIDLSKAFDTLNHNILIHKLRHYGLTESATKLLISYLSNQQPYVDFNGYKSTYQTVTTGVPQGSILAPLLFLIYINDLPEVSNVFDMLMYADDTTLYCNLNRTTTETEINCEMKKITTWLDANKLSLNVKKTKFMVFHTSQRKVAYPELIINGLSIERVSEFKFLGLVLSSNLKWHNHINYISIKISRIIGIMYRLKDVYPQAILQILYNSLIVPHFTFGLLSWGLKIGNGHKLHLYQKKALRIMTNSDYLAHTEPICKQLGIVKVHDMYNLAVWKFYYKLMNEQLPPYFATMTPKLPVICNVYEIRKPYYHLPKVKHEYAEQLIEYQMLKLLNDENGTILITAKVHTHTFQGFKLYLKNAIINSYTA